MPESQHPSRRRRIASRTPKPAAAPAKTAPVPIPTPADLSLVPLADLPRRIDDFLLFGDVQGHSDRTLTSRRERLTRFVRFLTDTDEQGMDAGSVARFLSFLRHGHEGDGGTPKPGGRWGDGKQTVAGDPRHHGPAAGRRQGGSGRQRGGSHREVNGIR